MPLDPNYLLGTDTQRVARNLGSVVGFSNAPHLHYRKWNAPVAASANAFVTTVAGPNTATVTNVRSGAAPFKIATGGTISGVTFTGASATGVLDCPRNVVITVTHGSAVVALSGTIYGTDEYGRLISEAWSVSAGGTTQTFTGKKAFWTVDGVVVTSVADASADSVVIGTGNVLGLPTRNAAGGVAAAVKELVDGAPVLTGTLVAASTATTADSQGTYLPATAPNGTHIYEVWYLENDPEL
jgi:hypothetical protein